MLQCKNICILTLCRSLLMVGVILSVPRKEKKIPRRMLRLRMTRAAIVRMVESYLKPVDIHELMHTP